LKRGWEVVKNLQQRLIVLGIIPLFLMTIALAGDATNSRAASLDWSISDGHFYTQANGQGGEGNTGFAVVDDSTAAFWSAFQSLGGVEKVGYPISQRFEWKGFTAQAFQKMILQWRPEAGTAVPVNVFDELSAAGKDGWLQEAKIVPPSQDWSSDRGLSWEETIQNHLALLEQNPAIKAAYWSMVDPITVFGLPMGYAEYGEVVVLRTQRAVFQQWKVDMPWAGAGQVVIANGGDVAKEAGLLPQDSNASAGELFDACFFAVSAEYGGAACAGHVLHMVRPRRLVVGSFLGYARHPV
jgi:hypothetical protein